jgi:RimJ/RimL family protein N-acetyltransferase
LENVMGETVRGTRSDLASIWPLFGLRILSGSLELRPVSDVDIPELVELARTGIHAPESMPFSNNWTDAPAGDLGRNMATYYWAKRADMSPARWTIDFVVRANGEAVGVQGLYTTTNYLVTKTCETGSWLASRNHGQGIGTLMRQTICQFAFDCLDAHSVTSAAWTDNPASLAVSRKVGYAPNGQRREERRPGEVAIMQDLVLTPQSLVRHGLGLDVEGLAEARAHIGLPPVRRVS